MSPSSSDLVAGQEALAPEIARRRTFAIISHPDAGKTTLTEKLLLYAGAIELAKGEKALADQGAVRDLTASLAEGLAGHVAGIRRRLPRLGRLVVQVDEPLLAAVVAAHGGTVGVENTPGGGATFTVQLPVYPPPLPAEAPVATRAPSRSRQPA